MRVVNVPSLRRRPILRELRGTQRKLGWDRSEPAADTSRHRVEVGLLHGAPNEFVGAALQRRRIFCHFNGAPASRQHGWKAAQ